MDLTGIHIRFIPNEDQRYNTAGDYGTAGDKFWWVDVSKTCDWRHSFLVLIHELAEMALTKNNGIAWEEIDYFDTEGGGKDHDDPGSLSTAPYHKEHMQAEQIERKLAEMLGVDWNAYSQALDSLPYPTGEDNG